MFYYTNRPRQAQRDGCFKQHVIANASISAARVLSGSITQRIPRPALPQRSGTPRARPPPAGAWRHPPPLIGRAGHGAGTAARRAGGAAPTCTDAPPPLRRRSAWGRRGRAARMRRWRGSGVWRCRALGGRRGGGGGKLGRGVTSLTASRGTACFLPVGAAWRPGADSQAASVAGLGERKNSCWLEEVKAQ